MDHSPVLFVLECLNILLDRSQMGQPSCMWEHLEQIDVIACCSTGGYANVDTTLNVYAQMIDGVVRAAVDKLGSKTALEYSGSDGRHTAIAALAEKGRPDWAQIGHVAPEMMKAVFLGVREEIVH